MAIVWNYNYWRLLSEERWLFRFSIFVCTSICFSSGNLLAYTSLRTHMSLSSSHHHRHHRRHRRCHRRHRRRHRRHRRHRRRRSSADSVEVYAPSYPGMRSGGGQQDGEKQRSIPRSAGGSSSAKPGSRNSRGMYGGGGVGSSSVGAGGAGLQLRHHHQSSSATATGGDGDVALSSESDSDVNSEDTDGSAGSGLSNDLLRYLSSDTKNGGRTGGATGGR
eukprot:GHVU01133290.1.p2 GENE.GHVU01133290.1~~GHVU01133290.1.p2  ORF type:complete len:220 (-),score=30.50 GHVU01133290.1:86-745(-)